MIITNLCPLFLRHGCRAFACFVHLLNHAFVRCKIKSSGQQIVAYWPGLLIRETCCDFLQNLSKIRHGKWY